MSTHPQPYPSGRDDDETESRPQASESDAPTEPREEGAAANGRDPDTRDEYEPL